MINEDKEDGHRNGVRGKVMDLFLTFRKGKTSALKLEKERLTSGWQCKFRACIRRMETKRYSIS